MQLNPCYRTVPPVRSWKNKLPLADKLIASAERRYGSSAINLQLGQAGLVAVMLAHLGVETLEGPHGFDAQLEEHGIRSVLEIGSGSNPFVLLFPDEVEYYGLDLYQGLQPEMLRLDAVKLGRMHFQLGDARKLGDYFSGMAFDWILCHGVLCEGGTGLARELQDARLRKRVRFNDLILGQMIARLSSLPKAGIFMASSCWDFLRIDAASIPGGRLLLWDEIFPAQGDELGRLVWKDAFGTDNTPARMAVLAPRRGLPQFLPKIKPQGKKPDDAAAFIRTQVARSITEIDKLIERLSASAVMELASQIEIQAHSVLDDIPIGDVDEWTLREILGWSHGISRQIFLLLRNNWEIAPFLKMKELSDKDLIEKITKDPAQKAAFIESRQGHRRSEAREGEVRALKENLLKLYPEIRQAYEKRHSSLIAGVLERGLIDDEGTALDAAISKEEYDELIRINALLGHDIKHSFLGFLISHKLGIDEESNLVSGGGKDPFKDWFPCMVPKLCNLRAHIEHYLNVLKITRSRLMGEFVKGQPYSLTRVLEVSAIAAGARLSKQINVSGTIEAGKINVQIDGNLGETRCPEGVELVLYDLMKNPLKAIEEVEKRDGTIVLKAARDPQYRKAVVITIEDNARVFNLRNLFKVGEKIAEDPKNAEMVAQHPTLQKILRWSKDNNVSRTFTLGELYELAFLATISGSSTESFSSGLDLDEVAKLAQVIGLEILIADTDSGGNVVTLVIADAETRAQIVQREMDGL
ncbi:MAG: hypothetical protein WCT39_03515 [Candidatus Margulisiibacteriota bacterium]